MDEIMRTTVRQDPQLNSQEDFLVAEARRSPQAFAALYDLYAQRVYRYLLSKTGNPQDAEDLTAQTFLAALQGLPKYRHHGKFAAWLFSIARNKAADHFRRLPPQVSLEDIGGENVGKTWSLGMEKSDRELDLAALIKELPDDEQEILRLRFVAEMRFREISALMGKSEGAVKKKVYRLLARLERQLEGSDA